MVSLKYLAVVSLLLLDTTACSHASAAHSGARPRSVAAEVRVTQLAPGTCSGAFVGRDLDHLTATANDVMAVVDGTGSGVAVGDLDGDGWEEIVLANLSGDVSILWNHRALSFERTSLTTGRYRQVLIVDVDADGRNDILLTTGVGPPSVYLSHAVTGDGHPDFSRSQLEGVHSFTYSVGVGDLHGTGSLDIVTGAYNAELTLRRDPKLLLGVDIGVNVQRPAAEGGYRTEELSPTSQSLVTNVFDLNGDGHDDVLIGNDLSSPDMTWLGGNGQLTPATPFETTSLSTMSIDVADYDNDGRMDLYATDMKPMPDESTATWEPIFEQIRAASIDQVQRPHNVLQHATTAGYEEVAKTAGVDATGWSWSGLFGDLDNDGWSDLFVVNGMEGSDLLRNTPDRRLVEANQAFRNSGDGRFAAAPQWHLGETYGGRGMMMADLDHDGDLDIVVNNLNAPARLLENQICGGSSVEVALSWPTSRNTAALGATVRARHAAIVRTRELVAGRGYLSGAPAVVHIGIGSEAESSVEVTWPDGLTSTVAHVAAGSRLLLTRTTA
jgi:enediyne biosynthesis protein E4